MSYYIPNIKALGLKVSDKKIFACFPYISQCKTIVTPGWGLFWPQGHNLNYFGVMLHTKYQGLKALWFQTRRFFHVFFL